jgi:DNA-binding SARP family transcriptional activator
MINDTPGLRMSIDGSPSPMPLGLHLFGPFAASVHGAPLPRLRSRKGQWLLALLVLRDSREVDRSWLMELLWPGAAPPQAAMSLRTSLRDLRQALGPEAGRLYSPTSRGLALDLAGATVDVIAFDQALARGDEASLVRAASLYRGPLLEGCAEEWCLPERQLREQALLAALETLASRAMERGEPSVAHEHLRRAVAVDPLRERAQRALMRALAADGNFAAALLTFRELRLLLHRELNAEPDPETQALFQ